MNRPGVIKRCLLRFRAHLAGKPYVNRKINLTRDGFELRWQSVDGLKQGHERVRWEDVAKVEAFKRDLLSVDLICTAFEIHGGISLECDEDWDGWQALVEALPTHLPGCRPFSDWWHPVAVPAFEHNLAIIYERGPSRKQPAI